MKRIPPGSRVGPAEKGLRGSNPAGRPSRQTPELPLSPAAPVESDRTPIEARKNLRREPRRAAMTRAAFWRWLLWNRAWLVAGLWLRVT